jgi:CheY-like chemotaxis protein
MTEPERTILVVDDDREVREVALTVLETAGYRVIEAVSGDDAHRFLVAHPDLRIDVLFTDVVMPGRLDGIDLAHAARLLRPELQVLFASGFPNLVREHADQEIRRHVLRKPYRTADLCRTILELLDTVD